MKNIVCSFHFMSSKAGLRHFAGLESLECRALHNGQLTIVIYSSYKQVVDLQDEKIKLNGHCWNINNVTKFKNKYVNMQK